MAGWFFTKTTGPAIRSRATRSREAVPALSDPKPTGTIGTCSPLNRCAAWSGATPLLLAPSERTTTATSFVPSFCFSDSSRAVPSAVNVPVGVRTSLGSSVWRRSSNRLARTSSLPANRFSASRPSASVFLAASNRLRLLASSVMAMLAESSSKNNTAACCLTFRMTSSEGFSAASKHINSAAMRRPSAT